MNRRMNLLWKRLCLCLVCFAALGSVQAIHAETSGEPAHSNKLVYVIPVKQTIESGLESFLKRAFSEAESVHAKAIVLEVNTLGGSIESAMGIGELIRTSPVPTIAYIQGNAISAGSYLALNADRIIMAPGSSIGGAAVVDGAGNRVTDSKVISIWVGKMKAAAELNDRNPLYAEGMVDDQTVVHVKEIGKTFDKGELITFTAVEAVKAGYAEGNAETLSDVLKEIGAEQDLIIKVEPTVAEKIAKFLTQPAVMAVLMILGLAGLVVELFIPGFGLPGILGVCSFALYFFGNYIAGFAGMEHIVLFVVGIILLALEIFVPSFGILGIAGTASLFSGIILAAYDTKTAMVSLGVAIAATLILAAILFKYFKHKGVWNRFILGDEQKNEEGYTSSSIKNELLYKTGVAITTLRPSGTALIMDERIDVVTSGQFIEQGRDIQVVKIEGGRVVVKEIESISLTKK